MDLGCDTQNSRIRGLRDDMQIEKAANKIDLARPDHTDFLSPQQESANACDPRLDLEIDDGAADIRHFLGEEARKDNVSQTDDELPRDS